MPAHHGNHSHQHRLQATHRTGHGLTYQANYTWAHDLSDAQGDAPTTAFQSETRYGLADEDRFDIKANRGNVIGTRRNLFLLTGTYELPFGQGRQWSSSSSIVDKLLGGWNVNTITLLETGPYLTPIMSVSEDQTNTNPAASGHCGSPGSYWQSNSRASDQTSTTSTSLPSRRLRQEQDGWEMRVLAAWRDQERLR
jgi:hypothetical protein